MFGSSVLDIALGLVFVFLVLSLICSAASELVEMLLKKRARDLEKGIAELVGDPANSSSFLAALYNHGLVNGLYRGTFETTPKWKLPSYIPARNFAMAIIDIRKKIPAGTLPTNVQTAFAAFEQDAAAGGKKLQESVEDWYNSSMDRVSGWYKRRNQMIILVLGAVVAAAVNADCIDIARRLSSDASLRQGVVALAEAAGKQGETTDSKTKPFDEIKENIKTLDSLGLPIGWPAQYDRNVPDSDRFLWAFSHHWLGWLLTAVAISMGASFWFDVLNKIIVVRSTVKPHEKSKEEGSKDGN